MAWFGTQGRFRKYLARVAAGTLLLAFFLGLWYLVPVAPKGSFQTGYLPQLLSFSPDGKTVVTADFTEAPPAGGPIYFWDVASCQKRLSIALELPRSGRLELSPDGHHFAAMVNGVAVTIWSTHSGEVLGEFSAGASKRIDFRFSPDGRYLIVERLAIEPIETPTLTFWEIESKTAKATFKGGLGNITLAPGTTTMGLIEGNRLQLWDLARAPEGATLLKEHDASGYPVVLSPDLKSLVTTIGDPFKALDHPLELKLYDIATGGEKCRCVNNRADLRSASVTFSPNGGFIIARERGFTPMFPRAILRDLFDPDAAPADPLWDRNWPSFTRIWDAKSGQTVIESAPHDAVISLDGRWLLTKNKNGVDVLDVATGLPHRSLYHPGDIRVEWDWSELNFLGQDSSPYCAFGPDSKTVIVTGLDNHQKAGRFTTFLARIFPGIKTGPKEHIARLWDVETGEELGNFEDCYQAFYSPDGKTLATAHTDGTVRLWDVPPRKPVLAILGTSLVLWLSVLVGIRLWGRLVRWWFRARRSA